MASHSSRRRPPACWLFFLLGMIFLNIAIAAASSIVDSGTIPNKVDPISSSAAEDTGHVDDDDELKCKSTQLGANDEVKCMTQRQTKESESSDQSSWTEWAKEKISEGLGFKQLQDDDPKDPAPAKASSSVADTATKTKDTLQDLASGAGEYSGEKAREMKNTGSKRAGDVTSAAKNKAGEMKDAAVDKGGELAEEAKEKAETASGAAKDKVRDMANEANKRKAETEENLRWAEEKAKQGYDVAKSKAGEKAKEGYDAAKNRAKQTLDSAKDTLSSTYDSSKHKSQQIKDNYMSSQGRDEEL